MFARLPSCPSKDQHAAARNGRAGVRSRYAIWHALYVVVAALSPATVGALSLGDIQVKSGIGNPLRAVVPMTVGEGEVLSGYCVNTGGRTIGLRVPRNLKVIAPAAARPGEYLVHISTPKPLDEPLYEFSIVVDCPDIPVVMRHYTMMLALPGDVPADEPVDDPPSDTAIITANITGEAVANEPVDEPANEPAKDPETPAGESPPEERAAEPRVTEPALTAAEAAPTVEADISPGTEYRVRKSDTLLTIAGRITDRPSGAIWQAAELIFQTNPDAFIARDADRIRSGVLLRIPDADELATLTNSPAAARTALRTAAAATSPEPVAEPETVAEPEPAETIAPEPETTAPEPIVSAPDEPAVAETPIVETGVPEAPPVEPVAPKPTFVDQVDQGTTVESAPDATMAPESPAVAAPPETAFVETAAPATTPADATEPGSIQGETMAQPAVAVSAGPAPIVAAAVQPAARTPVASDMTDTLIATGVGAILGFLLSLVILRGKLVAAIADLFRARKRAVAKAPAVAEESAIAEAPPKPNSANSIVTEATEFLDTLADEAFETNAEFAQKSGVLSVNEVIDATIVAEEDELQLKQATDTVTLDDEQVAMVDNSPAAGSDLPDENVLTDFFEDEKEATDSEVIDPTASIAMDEFEPDAGASAQSFDPTAEVPSIDFVESAADLPDDEVIDPTAEATGINMVDVIDPTAEMPRQDPQVSAEPIAQDSSAPGPAAEEPEAGAGEFDFSDSMLTKALSEDLDAMEPGDMFAASGDEFDSGADQTEQLLTGELTETGLQAIPENFDNNENSLTSALDDPMALLETEYEDEFTSSQILEQTAIKEALAKPDSPEADEEEDPEDEREKAGTA